MKEKKIPAVFKPAKKRQRQPDSKKPMSHVTRPFLEAVRDAMIDLAHASYMNLDVTFGKDLLPEPGKKHKRAFTLTLSTPDGRRSLAFSIAYPLSSEPRDGYLGKAIGELQDHIQRWQKTWKLKMPSNPGVTAAEAPPVEPRKIKDAAQTEKPPAPPEDEPTPPEETPAMKKETQSQAPQEAAPQTEDVRKQPRDPEPTPDTPQFTIGNAEDLEVLLHIYNNPDQNTEVLKARGWGKRVDRLWHKHVIADTPSGCYAVTKYGKIWVESFLKVYSPRIKLTPSYEPSI